MICIQGMRTRREGTGYIIMRKLMIITVLSGESKADLYSVGLGNKERGSWVQSL